MEPLLSVIVPVFNVENYLKECIDSIQSQTYRNLEIILVDDGSTDKSGTICDNYAETDSRFIVLHKTNGGLSSSRNSGLEIASGEYVTFADSDDVIIGKNVFAEIMACFESDNSADVVQYDVIHKYTSSDEHKRIYPFKTYNSKSEILDGYLSQHIHVSCCDKVFRTSVFKNIRFPENQISEDIAIIPQIIDNITRLVASPIGFYGYRYRDGSITNSVLPYNKICSILNSYSTYLNYSMGYESGIARKALLTYVHVFWAYLSDIRRMYPTKCSDTCSHRFFIRLSFREWLKLCKGYSIKDKVRSYILCCLGPNSAFKFQRLLTRQ